MRETISATSIHYQRLISVIGFARFLIQAKSQVSGNNVIMPVAVNLSRLIIREINRRYKSSINLNRG